MTMHNRDVERTLSIKVNQATHAYTTASGLYALEERSRMADTGRSCESMPDESLHMVSRPLWADWKECSLFQT